MKNIAIMGSSGGAGKDTVADIITDITGIDYQKISWRKKYIEFVIN